MLDFWTLWRHCVLKLFEIRVLDLLHTFLSVGTFLDCLRHQLRFSNSFENIWINLTCLMFYWKNHTLLRHRWNCLRRGLTHIWDIFCLRPFETCLERFDTVLIHLKRFEAVLFSFETVCDSVLLLRTVVILWDLFGGFSFIFEYFWVFSRFRTDVQ